MKRTSKLFVHALTAAALSAGVWAQTQTAANNTPPNPATAPAATPTPQPPITAADIQALKDALAAQQAQIQALKEQLLQKNGGQQLQPAAAKPVQATEQVAVLDVPGIQQDNLTSASSQQNPDDQPQTFDKNWEGPLTIHFKGINITPGGYAEAAFVRRSRALAADLPTPFNSVPLPGASQSQMSEFFGSGRQSKITTFVDGRLKGVDLSSYVSADFLSAGVTSTSNQTNSYTLRLRQAWAQAKFQNGFSFVGGQMWSLVTENGHGIAPDDDLGRSNDARPKTIDPSYNVGFVFARQYGIRVAKTFGDKVAIAFAVENPQATLTSHGNGTNYLLGSNGASNSYNTTATYSFNPSPDLIAKVAFDPGFGHYEVFGLYDNFRDRVFPCGEVAATATCGGQAVGITSAYGAYNSSKSGGAIGASARWNIADRVTFGLKGFGGSGVGRYGPGGIADTAVNADGTLHLIKNLLGLSTLEIHLTKKLDFVGYGGAEYGARTASYDPIGGKTGKGAAVGYGAPTFVNTGCYLETPPATSTANGTAGFDPGALANCTGDTRAVIEGTGGFWYKFYSGNRGSFRFGAMYSYVTRNTWSGVGGDPHGVDNMIFTSFRYYLP